MHVRQWSATVDTEPPLHKPITNPSFYHLSLLHLQSSKFPNFFFIFSEFIHKLVISLCKSFLPNYQIFLTFFKSKMVKTSKTVPPKEKAFSSQSATDKTPVDPRPEECAPAACVLTSDFKLDKGSPVPGRCEPVSRYICSITREHIERIKKDCNWENKEVVVSSPEEDITTHVKGFLRVYTYPFTLGPLDPVIIDFCRKYLITIGQIHPSFWRIVILIRYFVSKIKGMPFTLDHLVRLYRPRLFRGGLIKLQRRATKALFSSIDEDKDRDWMGQFVRVRISDLIPTKKMHFPEEWNLKPVPWMPGAVPGLKSWVRDLVSTYLYAERSWRDLSKGRWEAKNHGVGKDVELRPSSVEEEASASVPKPVKDNKRKKAPVLEDQKPKKRTARKPNKNATLLTVESVLHLRDEEEEENDGSALAARTKKTIDVPQAVVSMVVHKALPRTEDISERDSGRVPELLEIKDISHRS
ncbi:uncharacterized protein LOC107766799 [Nicotiana tabacum]|uniref:Uncharacterized protein LOC107766799 n=1 Tax=Nicotiana tabacum TaxID=4097 RepID=A0A1S3XMS8_TOBAC|nr:PREDICTED: uncharacterized protein LOC107766799 isoform X2 [Nicotiana tabacum]